MNITITNVKNAKDLEIFIPVDGEWHLSDPSEAASEKDIQTSVKNWMDADFPIDVRIYSMEGHSIVDDIPTKGLFLATRRHTFQV